MSDAATLTLCKKSEVSEDKGFKVKKDDLSVAVFHVEGEFFVIDDLCTHGPGSMSQGFLEGYIIECDFHAGCFDIRTGEVTSPPCMVPMRAFKVVNDLEDVVIELPSA
jgi:nitrite reductase/ring-hydroxylating ferredoxin subunit